MKFFKQTILAIALLTGIQLQAQDAVLMTVDNKPVYKSEFESIFKKNNNKQEITQAALDEYIDLFVKFKLKVNEAEKLGLDTVSSFITELAGYRRQLAKPYLTDNKLTDELLKEAYERMQYEVKASHILIKVGSEANPNDTIAAYKKVLDIKKKLANGEDFSTLAKTYSDDPSAKDNGGDLGYFTGLAMVYPFESAAFNTPVGKVSDPVRTTFGYHIVKVIDKRAARGEVTVAHILVQQGENPSEITKQNNKNKIFEIYNLAKGGEDFAGLAKKYSEDNSSAEKGGVLPAFGTGKMVEQFENESFKLNEVNAISLPFETPYGWHIVKLIDKKAVPSYEELKPQLVRRVTRDDRSRITRNSFIQKLKNDYKIVLYSENLKSFYKLIDTNFYNGSWKKPASDKLTKVIAKGDAGFQITQNDFANYMFKMNGNVERIGIKNLVDNYFDYYFDAEILNFEDSRLEQKYPEFKALVKEYRDGILLFDLTNKMVWNKAVQDTLGLDVFFQEHIAEYQWKERANYTLYRVKDKKLAKQAYSMVKKGLANDSIKRVVNTNSQLNLTIDENMAERGTNSLLEKFTWKKGISPIQEIDEQFVFVKFVDIYPAQAKKLVECRGIVTAAYQNYLEETWLKSLKDNHQITVDKAVLYSVK